MLKTTKKTVKPVKKMRSKKGLRHVADNVEVHTSLPPKVEGQIRCHLRLSVPEITWAIDSPPDFTSVRVKWWGEDRESVFVPLDMRKTRNLGGTATIARYAIRSGPKQFAAYLSDMKALSLDVLSGPNRATVGKCVINDIHTLSQSAPIVGVYPALSQNGDKIAELKVSMRLESLMASYDSNVSVVTDAVSAVDQSVDSLRPTKHEPVPSSKPRVHDESRDPFISPVAKAGSKAGLQGVDHSFYSQDLQASIHEKPTRDVGLNVQPTAAREALYQLDLASRPSADLISALLDRGTRLKKAMVVSSLDDGTIKPSQSNPDVSVYAGTEPAPPVNRSLRRTSSTGDLFRALLSERAGQSATLDQSGMPVRGLIPGETLNETDIHTKAVDLVLGSNVTSKELAHLRAMLEGQSPSSTLSEEHSTLTDTADPARDDSILEELFYSKTAHDSDDAALSDDNVTKNRDDVTRARTRKRHPSLESPGNRRPPSRDVTPRGSRDNTPTRSRQSSVDDDQTSTGSRVSFDMPASDDEEARSRVCDGLSVERLTLLGKVNKARVAVEALHLAEEAPRKDGKPPRPDTARKSGTYFVEYQFPVNATSRDSKKLKATEVMRVASKKITDNNVSFSHRSVYPVLFDGDCVETWWKAALLFKIYARPVTQKTPTLTGTGSVSLKSLLKSDSLYVDRSLPIRSTANDKLTIGKLKVCLELASDNKDFANALAKTRLAEMKNPKNVVSVVRRERTPKKKTIATKKASPAKPTVPAEPMRITVPPPAVQQPATEAGEAVTLHTLLMISEGRNITVNGTRPKLQTSPDKGRPHAPPQPTTGSMARDACTRNTYLVCRMFWLSDNVTTNVCWGTQNPKYDFCQVAPILVTQSLLERMRNNVMVVEVWDKKTTAEKDKLVGLVKLPLHQFYLSFRDRRILASLLKSRYPVTAVDQYLPVLDPFSGRQYGQIHVTLAMGSDTQVATVQRAKLDPTSVLNDPTQKPANYFERQDLVNTEGRRTSSGDDDMTQHVFELVVEGVRELDLGEDMAWGEVDVFVQYHFPTQQAKDFSQQKHVSPTLKPHRTTSTLCVPDPMFHDVTSHRLVLPQGTPVQREILAACAGVGGGAGGVPFELWCRHYTPNVRDQVIGKTSLPLARLCALITMHQPSQPSVQTFSLPLKPWTADTEDPTKMGLLDVTLTYKPSSFVTRSSLSVSKNLATSQVCLSVGVLRASGLKSAAEALARLNSSLQYPSEVGVNAYCRVKLSFLSKEDERLTKTVARSFSPEFSHHLDFPCPLLWCEAGTDALSLAEILESANVTVDVWHQIPGTQTDREVMEGSDDVVGRKLIATFSDTLLGSVTIPLKPLLYKKTGIKGWYAINLPPLGWQRSDSSPEAARPTPSTNQQSPSASAPGSANQLLARCVGGLEMSVRLAHHDDRERVLHAGRSVGWIQEGSVDDEWETLDDSRASHHMVSVHVDHVCFSLINALSAGKTTLDKNTACYIRYKFYDKAAVCSRLQRLSSDDPVCRVSLDHRKVARVQASSPFHWYLREERLEIQVWVTTSVDSSQRRPRHRDKLIGSAFIDLTALVSQSSRQHRVSDVFPLFKPGAPSLQGACLRCTVSLEPDTRMESTRYQTLDGSTHPSRTLHSDSDSDECMLSEDEVRVYGDKPQPKSPGRPSEDTSFPCLVSVERALHLPEINDNKTGTSVLPSAYVSYETADQLTRTYTSILPEQASPVWSHQHQTRLRKDLLSKDEKILVLKVWHRVAPSAEPDPACDRVIGFVSVDLAPLVYGLQICGWYNIIDFLGQCQGQIKISVIPQGRLDLKDDKTKEKPAAKTAGSAYSYASSATYPSFPAHIARFSEQALSVAPPSGQPANHEPDDKEPASRSMLFRTLRSNLDELDQINSRLASRLKLGTGSSVFQPVKETERTNVAKTASTSSKSRSKESERSVASRKANLSTVRELEKESGSTPPTKDETLAQASIDDALSRARRLLEIGGFSSDSSKSPELREAQNNNATGNVSAVTMETSRRHDDNEMLSSAPITSSTRLVQSESESENESESDHEDYISRHFRDESREEYESDVDEDSVVVPRPLNNISCMTFSNALDESWRSVQHLSEPRDFHELSSMRSTDAPDSPVMIFPKKKEPEKEESNRRRQLQYLNDEKETEILAAKSDRPSSRPDMDEILNGSRGISGIDIFPDSPRDEIQASGNESDSDREKSESVVAPEPFEIPSESDQKSENSEPKSYHSVAKAASASPEENETETTVCDKSETESSDAREISKKESSDSESSSSSSDLESEESNNGDESDDEAEENGDETTTETPRDETTEDLTEISAENPEDVTQVAEDVTGSPEDITENAEDETQVTEEEVSTRVDDEAEESVETVNETVEEARVDSDAEETVNAEESQIPVNEEEQEGDDSVEKKCEEKEDLVEEEHEVEAEEPEPEPVKLTRVDKEKSPDKTTKPPAKPRSVPDYFLPAEELAKSMQALRMATALQPKTQRQEERLQQRASMMRQFMDKMPPPAARARPRDDVTIGQGDVISPVKQASLARQSKPLPTADEARRIAKIFSSRFPRGDS